MQSFFDKIAAIFSSYHVRAMARIFLFLASIFSSPYSFADGPSFDCTKVTKADEIAICTDSVLSANDQTQSDEYYSMKRRIGSEEGNRIAKQFLKERRNCGRDVDCISNTQERAISAFRAAGTEPVERSNDNSLSDQSSSVLENSSGDEVNAGSDAVARNTNKTDKEALNILKIGITGYVIALIIALVIYFLPSYIAFKREHEYRWVILVMNVIGFLWPVAFIWAVFPSNKSAIDPVVGSATGIGPRNAGDVIGEARYANERAYFAAIQSAPIHRKEEVKQGQSPASDERLKNKLAILESLAQLRKEGVLTEEEFNQQKAKILDP